MLVGGENNLGIALFEPCTDCDKFNPDSFCSCLAVVFHPDEERYILECPEIEVHYSAVQSDCEKVLKAMKHSYDVLQDDLIGAFCDSQTEE